MERTEFIKKFFAGIFFILGICLFFTVLFILSKDKGLTQPRFQVQVLYRNVGGLMEGAPIRLSGVNVGNVASINFLDKDVKGRRVRVTLNIFEKYRKQLNSNARFAIKTEGVLGEKLIEIYYVGEGGGPIDLSKPIIGEDPLDVQDLAEAFTAAARSFTKTSEEFGRLDVQELADVVAETAHTLSLTAEGINCLLKDMGYITKKTRRILNRIEQRMIDGNLFKVF